MDKKLLGYVFTAVGFVNLLVINSVSNNILGFLTFLGLIVFGIILLSKEDTPVKTLFDKFKNKNLTSNTGNPASQLNITKNENQNSNSFPIPLWMGWLVNIIGWVLFVSTFNHTLEIVTGILCVGCVFVGYSHKQIDTPAFLGINYLNPANLIWASAIEAIWMFAWGFGFFGDFNF